MSDLIDRQKAINVIERMRAYIGHNMERAVGSAFIEILDDIGEDIGRLPSAQPEIIVCEDCKWRISENRKTTSLWLPCRALVTPDKFSCIHAERREVTE